MSQWGQQSSSWGQGGSSGQGAPQGPWGQSAPEAPGGYGGSYSASPYGSSPGGAMAPVKRRGMVRIVLGIIGILLALLGIFLGPMLGAMIGGIFSFLSISSDAITVVPPGSPVHLETGTYIVAATSERASCEVRTTNPGDMEYTPTGDGLHLDKDGTQYSRVGQLDVTTASDAVITCNDGSDAAIGRVGFAAVAVGLAIGVGIPVLLGLAGLVLLISGIIGRVRSGRGQ